MIKTLFRVAILTGSGQSAFCTGVDLKELKGKGPLEAKKFSEQGQLIFNLIEDLGKPVIAAVNGFALGGGCELAMACTLRVASQNARFGFPEVGLGIIPGFGGTHRLSRLVGLGKSLEMIATGAMISAEEANSIGLVNAVTTDKNLIPKAMQMAKDIMSNAPQAVRWALEAIYGNAGADRSDGMALESTLFALSFGTKDKEEGIKAFLEKREAKFSGF